MSRPEDLELASKRAALDALEAQLVALELELATTQAGMDSVDARYHHLVAPLMVELDALEASMLAGQLEGDPEDAELRRRAEGAMQRARASAEALGVAQEATPVPPMREAKALKDLYRRAALAIHPDLARDPDEIALRTGLMADLNAAYARGDEAAIQDVLSRWETAPEAVHGTSPGAELVRAIRTIARAQRRIDELRKLLSDLKECPTYALWLRVSDAAAEGRDLLEELAADLRERIHAIESHSTGMRRKKGWPAAAN